MICSYYSGRFVITKISYDICRQTFSIRKYFVKIKSVLVLYMSSTTTTTPVPPFQQWQQFFPNGAPYGYDNVNNVNIHDQIYATVAGNAERTKQQAANDIARDILRAVDHNGATNSHITERNASQLMSAIDRNGSTAGHITELSTAQLATAIERNGANNASTTERVNSQLASAVERNGAANNSAIERTAGEARLTTVIADAASRQAANDSARDIMRGIDRANSEAVAATKDTFGVLNASIERNAGESRVQTLTSSGILESSLRDVRYSVLNELNRGTTDVIGANTQNFNVLNKSITDGAWEQRTATAAGFQNLSEEHLRTKHDLSLQASQNYASNLLETQKLAAIGSEHYSSLLMEQQKLGQFLGSKADNHFAMNTLEMQKVKEGLAAQASNYYASNQLELQKVKEGLATQSAQQFAISQLENQKIRESISNQLADAKYEALKSQQFLADKLCECCCSIKEKVDNIDRDRLRDNLNVSKDRNSMFEMMEFAQLYLDGDRRGGHGRHGRHGGHHGDH